MDSLVKVQSFLGVAEAELARIRLAMDDIPARLSNAEMVIWFWHYSNVTGGVKLFVNSSDLPSAAIILSPQPVPQQFQPPRWLCPKCQADVDGLWSFCWSCGTSETGEEDPDFHAWYRESVDDVVSPKYNTETVAAVVSVLCIALFIIFKAFPAMLFVWLIVLILLSSIFRELSTKKKDLINTGDSCSEMEPFSDTHHDPSSDEFNPADATADRFWKAAMFSLGWSAIFYPFALWSWYKTHQNAASLSENGLRRYYYSLIVFIISVTLFGLFWLDIFFIVQFHPFR